MNALRRGADRVVDGVLLVICIVTMILVLPIAIWQEWRDR